MAQKTIRKAGRKAKRAVSESDKRCGIEADLFMRTGRLLHADRFAVDPFMDPLLHWNVAA